MAKTGGRGEGGPQFAVATQRAGDVVTVTVADDTAVFDVTSQTGIGGATISLAAGEWPAAAELRLHLRGLESLRLAYGEVVVETAVAATGDQAVRQTVRIGEEIRPSGEAAFMPVTIVAVTGEAKIPLVDGYFTARLPADLLSGDYDAFSIEWVDFFR